MGNRKNICISINSMAIGGAEKQSILLAKALQERHNCYLVIIKPYPRDSAYMETLEKEKINYLFLEGTFLSKFWEFAQFLKEKKIELIFSYLPTDILYSAISGKLAGVPYIFSGIRNAKMHPFKTHVLKFIHNYFSDCTISNSISGSRFFIRKGFNASRMIVIPNGIVIHTQPFTRKQKDEVIITSVGRFVKQKDYESALKSIAYLKEKFDLPVPLKYWIIGYGKEEQNIRKWINAYQLQQEIELIISPNNFDEIFRETDIYLTTSTFEGLSNSIMEAMSYSLPVIATRVGDNDQLVRHGRNGFIAEARDYKSIAGYLQKLIISPKERVRMGGLSYSHLKDNYSYEQFKKRYMQVIEDLEHLTVQAV